MMILEGKMKVVIRDKIMLLLIGSIQIRFNAYKNIIS